MWYIENQADGTRYELKDGKVIIGREVGNVLIPESDARSSRSHALVRVRNGAVEVEDLKSLNGTFLDEVRVDDVTTWEIGQTLRCGRTLFRLGGDPPATPREHVPVPEVIPAPTAANPQVTAKLTAEAPAAGSAGMYVDAPALEPGSLSARASSQQSAEPEPIALPDHIGAAEAPSPAPPRLPDYNRPWDAPARQQSPPPGFVPFADASRPAPGGLPGYNRPPTTAASGGAVSGLASTGLILGAVLLIAGLFGWQHYQPQVDMLNSMLGQFAVGIGGNSAAQDAEAIRLYYMGSIVSACLGGLLMLGSGITLAMGRK